MRPWLRVLSGRLIDSIAIVIDPDLQRLDGFVGRVRMSV
jgi:hypothetical protein